MSLNIVTDFSTWIQSKSSVIWIELLIVFSIIVIFNLFRGQIAYFIIKTIKWKEKDKKKIKNNSFYKPLKTFLLVLVIYLGILYLKLPESIINIVSKLFRVITIILIANGFANLVRPESTIYNKLKENEKFKGNDNILNFISKIVKIITYTIATFIVLAEFGYNLNGIVAGLGLGSVVVALASQDIAKSLFAGAMIFMDKPFTIGDYIVVANYEGTVEDIKFRSTRIRLLDGSVVTIPNHLITESNINNWNGIEQRRYKTDIKLSINNELSIVKEFIVELKSALDNNGNIKENSANVIFSEIKEDSFVITIYFYTDVVNYGEYIELKQSVNFYIMDLLKQKNLKLSCNASRITLEK